MTDLHQLSREDQRKIYNSIRVDKQMLRETILGGTLKQEYVAEFEKEDIFKDVCDEFITEHEPPMLMKANAIKLAHRPECVLITGASGTGKELIAQILHGTRKGNFVAVNTCAITDTLFESELFGHVRGSFTGALTDRDGLIKETDGEKVGHTGTLFLDEIGDMPLHLQPKLLRMIQNRTYRRVGSSKDEQVRCRVIAATHQDLPKLIADGKFRLDLYERLNVFHLHIPPLYERRGDIKLHVDGDLHTRIMLHTEGLAKYLQGNVRQLLNLKLRAEVLGLDSVGKEDVL